MTKFEKARRWREALFGTGLKGRVALSDRIGYSPEAVYWMEVGKKAGGREAVAPWVFLRYQRACEGVQREMDTGKSFGW